METVLQQQASPYNESDFDRAEAELAVWRSLHEAPGWPAFARTAEGMLAGWRAALETLSGSDVAKTQGMIAGVKVLLTLPAAKQFEVQQTLETMRLQNEAHSASERDNDDA